MPDRIEIVTGPIPVEGIVAGLTDPEIGAVATFTGVVRGASGGRPVLRLEYEAYPQMAVEAFARIAAEVKARWKTIAHVAIVHRVGTLQVGETAVVVAVASGHRRETFPALTYAIDRLKEVVPIWKKEIGEEGGAWKSEAQAGRLRT